MSDAADTAESDATESERHATWPELFFDLVAVAGVSIVAHQLEETHGWQHIGILAIAFIAFWVLWASVTTYGNLLADRTSTLVLFVSMAVLGVMVASVPGIFGEHARTFAIAYVVGRLLMARPWKRNAVVVDMPIVQASIGVIPWIVSIWVSGDARYILWAVGAAFDLFILLTYQGERAVEVAQRRLDEVLTARGKRGERHTHGASAVPPATKGPDAMADSSGQDASRRGPQGGRYRELPTTIEALRGDTAHLSERMGLFVLIILGEAIVQLTVAAENSEHWNKALLLAAVGAFAFVSLLFLISVVRGTAGLALLPPGLLPARLLWVGHLLISMALVTVGAALGRLLEEPHEPPSAHTAIMLGVGTAVFGLVSAGAHLLSKEPHAVAVAAAVAVPLVAAAVVLQVTRSSLAAGTAAWILAAATLAVPWLASRSHARQQQVAGD